LERSVVAVDGGRLKLAWELLGPGDRVDVVLFEQDGDLVGFGGIYRYVDTVELVGMVDPRHRRRGIGTALLQAALRRCRAEGVDRPLVIVPRTPAGGEALVRAHGGTLDHSEHVLALTAPPAPPPRRTGATWRRATHADEAEVGRLLEAAFDEPFPGLRQILASDQASTLLIELEGAPVGTLRIHRHGAAAGIYGFAVDPARQGRGLGRDILARVCEDLRDRGVRTVSLEVAVDNDHALSVYTATGFVPVATEDYFALGRWRPYTGT
jgi:ribosomal protein S18 acetylase RimI-like enzyme